MEALREKPTYLSTACPRVVVGAGADHVNTVGTLCCCTHGTTGGLRRGGAGAMGALASDADKVRQQADERHDCSVGAIFRVSKSQDSGLINQP